VLPAGASRAPPRSDLGDQRHRLNRARRRTRGVAPEKLIDNPQDAIDGIFLFAQDVNSYIIRSTLLRLESTSALPGDD
jgi:hypothetical protein